MGVRSRAKAKMYQTSDKIDHQQQRYGASDGIQTLIHVNLTDKMPSVFMVASNLFELLFNWSFLPCLAPAQQDLLTTLYVQSDRTGEGEMFTEEEISMLWKRSSDCLERSVIVSFRWLVSHPYCGYTHLRHDTSREDDWYIAWCWWYAAFA